VGDPVSIVASVLPSLNKFELLSFPQYLRLRIKQSIEVIREALVSAGLHAIFITPRLE